MATAEFAIDSRFDLEKSPAIYATQMRGFKKHIPLDWRVHAKLGQRILQDPKPYFERRVAMRKHLAQNKPLRTIPDTGFVYLPMDQLPGAQERVDYWAPEAVRRKEALDPTYAPNDVSHPDVVPIPVLIGNIISRLKLKMT